jgi:hypothetical protein
VVATNRCETADVEVLVAVGSTWLPTGASPWWRSVGSTACQHPLQGQPVQQLGRGECRPGRHSQLGGADGAAHPRPIHPHPAAAQGDPAGLGAVTDRGPVGMVAALGTGQPVHLGGQHDLEHPQADPYGQASRPSRDRSACGGPLLVEQLGGCPTPTTRQASGGDRHRNFYEARDNLRWEEFLREALVRANE